MLCDTPDPRKDNCVEFPEADIWGVVMPAGCKLAKKKTVRVDDLVGLPLFCSQQSWKNDIPRWAGERMSELTLEGSFRLAYNSSIFVMEGLGYLLTFDKLINTSEESGLVFRPLSPRLETKLFLIRNKFQTFTPIAERFLDQVTESFYNQ